ncbi:MAG: hypothetical protein WAU36_13585 [Cyclobacteriaceae bacterium]
MSRKKKNRTRTDAGREKSAPKETQPASKKKLPVKHVALYVVLALVGIFAAFKLFNNWSGESGKAEVSYRKPFPAVPAKMLDNVSFEDFVGAEACSSCHSDIYNKWKSSTHGQAGGSPKDVKVIGKFDGVPRRFKDAVLTPYRAPNGDYMFNLKTIGLPEQTFKVDGVVGGGHMIAGGTQTYFSYFPDGTM